MVFNYSSRACSVRHILQQLNTVSHAQYAYCFSHSEKKKSSVAFSAKMRPFWKEIPVPPVA